MAGALAGGPPLEVVAGALVDAHGRVLIAQRPAGKSFAGRWEFPGGKRAPGEAARAALGRELAEELGIEVTEATPLLAVRHRYPGAQAAVHIDCWRVTAWRGTPAGLDGQQLRWCTRAELPGADILEADRPLVTALVLPAEFVRVPADEPLVEHVPAGPRPGRIAWLVEALPADLGVVRRLEEHGDLVFVLDPRTPPAGGAGSVYSRPHAMAHDALGALAGRLLGSPAEAARAAEEGADFLLLPAPAAGRAPLAALAEAGLPWYLDAAAATLPGADGATGRYRPAPAIATGRL
jgi:8-oxo-dGTP diphosphatase